MHGSRVAKKYDPARPLAKQKESLLRNNGNTIEQYCKNRELGWFSDCSIIMCVMHFFVTIIVLWQPCFLRGSRELRRPAEGTAGHRNKPSGGIAVSGNGADGWARHCV
jgi:hypothetical protein